jgi:hypothetical protein
MRSREELASEVERRNKLRTQFGMATIPVSAEVEKLYSAALRKAFRDWSETYPHRAEIEAEVLQIIREEKRDPHWLPRGLLNGALWFGHLVRKRLHRIRLQEMQNFDESGDRCRGVAAVGDDGAATSALR